MSRWVLGVSARGERIGMESGGLILTAEAQSVLGNHGFALAEKPDPDCVLNRLLGWW